MPLADFQTRVRGAIIDGELSQLTPVLIGGCNPVARFAIHQRHYEASLVRALAGKFPALVWLVGSPLVNEAARGFVHDYPPREPCIAEYGGSFPAYLASGPGVQRIPWVRWVGELEWLLGRAALEVEHAPLAVETLTRLDAGAIADCTLTLQPGLSYLAAPWPVDELVTLFLSDAAPQSFALDAEEIRLEIRGARGAFSINRLDNAAFAFRKALLAGLSVGGAAEQALDADPGFDAGSALLQLVAAGLATAIGGAARDTQP